VPEAELADFYVKETILARLFRTLRRTQWVSQGSALTTVYVEPQRVRWTRAGQ
jgi:hypothetical protein